LQATKIMKTDSTQMHYLVMEISVLHFVTHTLLFGATLMEVVRICNIIIIKIINIMNL
jgi:hypothetical protein